MAPDDHGVLGTSRRRGTSRHSLTASPRERRGTFAPGGSTQVRTPSLPHPSSVQPTVDSGRRLARGVTKSGDLRCPISWRTCTAQGTASMVRTWLAACFPSEGGGLSHTARVERSVRKAEANASARAATPSCRGERGSDARGRARASLNWLQKSTDSGRRREADAPPFHPIWKRSGTGA
jgi:hypothetical protein